jgi:hypothetical protein
MGDPLYHDDEGRRRLLSDPGVGPVVRRVHRLKVVSGLVALALIAAIWIVWRWQGGD